MRIFKATVFILFLAVNGLLGQAVDTTAHVSGKDQSGYAQLLYQEATRESQYLYNGKEYLIYDANAREHQFFESEEFEEGIVQYDGRAYAPVPLLYDIVKDEVIVEHYRGFGNVQLQKEKVQSFTLANHTFVRMEEGQTGLSTGFYDLLYDGTLKLMVKRIKERQEKIDNMQVVVVFPAKKSFYLYKNGTYHPVKSKRSLLKLLGDRKKELKKYVRANKLRFRQNRENAIAKLTAYYDRLTR